MWKKRIRWKDVDSEKRGSSAAWCGTKGLIQVFILRHLSKEQSLYAAHLLVIFTTVTLTCIAWVDKGVAERMYYRYLSVSEKDLLGRWQSISTWHAWDQKILSVSCFLGAVTLQAYSSILVQSFLSHQPKLPTLKRNQRSLLGVTELWKVWYNWKGGKVLIV